MWNILYHFNQFDSHTSQPCVLSKISCCHMSQWTVLNRSNMEHSQKWPDLALKHGILVHFTPFGLFLALAVSRCPKLSLNSIKKNGACQVLKFPLCHGHKPLVLKCGLIHCVTVTGLCWIDWNGTVQWNCLSFSTITSLRSQHKLHHSIHPNVKYIYNLQLSPHSYLNITSRAVHHTCIRLQPYNLRPSTVLWGKRVASTVTGDACICRISVHHIWC